MGNLADSFPVSAVEQLVLELATLQQNNHGVASGQKWKPLSAMIPAESGDKATPVFAVAFGKCKLMG